MVAEERDDWDSANKLPTPDWPAYRAMLEQLGLVAIDTKTKSGSVWIVDTATAFCTSPGATARSASRRHF